MKAHEIKGVRFCGDEMIVLVEGQERIFLLADVSPRLAAASPEERERFEVSPSGYGIHWPLLDEDLSIDGLLGITHCPAPARKRADERRGARPQSAP